MPQDDLSSECLTLEESNHKSEDSGHFLGSKSEISTELFGIIAVRGKTEITHSMSCLLVVFREIQMRRRTRREQALTQQALTRYIVKRVSAC